MPRPSQPILSRDLIFGTALRLLDRTGRFTVPEVAQQLGVSVSSLYHHVTGRAEIIEGIRGLMTADGQTQDDPWPVMVREWARHYRDSFARHPAAIPALVAQTVSAPGALRLYDALVAVLDDAGFGPRSIVLSVSMLDTLCLGAALDLGAPSVIWERQSPLHQAIADTQFDNGRSDAAFELQLSWIIEGMAGLLTGEQDGATTSRR